MALKILDASAAATAFINAIKVLDAEQARGPPVQGDTGSCIPLAHAYRHKRGEALMQFVYCFMGTHVDERTNILYNLAWKTTTIPSQSVWYDILLSVW
jgi:hypothetical protein